MKVDYGPGPLRGPPKGARGESRSLCRCGSDFQLALKEDQEKQLEALVKSLSKCKPSPGRKAEKTAVKQEWWVLHAIGKYQQGLMSWEDLCGSVRGPLATFPKESRPHPLL